MGGMALSALIAWFYGYLSLKVCGNIAVVTGTLHFYFMEIDAKYVLHVRPFAYLPFPLCAIALVYFNFMM